MKFGGEIAGGIFVMTLIYFASPILVIKWMGTTPPPSIEKAFSIIYYPAGKAYELCPPYQSFLDWQVEKLDPFPRP